MRSKGNRMVSWGDSFSGPGLGHQVSGSGVLVQVRVRGGLHRVGAVIAIAAVRSRAGEVVGS